MAQKIVTKTPVRLSYPALFQPKAPMSGQGDPKYQATFLIPKSDTETVNALFAAINAEMAEAAAPAGKWKGAAPASPPVTFYDGDQPNPKSGKPWGEECRGCYILRTSANNKPDVVDEYGNKALDATKFYAGCWVYASVAIAAYDNSGSKGISAFVNCVMFARDDQPLDGHASASDDFKDLIANQATAAPAAFPVPAPGAPQYGAPYGQPQAGPQYGAPYAQPQAAPQQPVVSVPPYGGPNPWGVQAAPQAPAAPIYGIPTQQ